MKKLILIAGLALSACGVDGEPTTPGASTTKAKSNIAITATAEIGIAGKS